jgi:hypothetical protein
MNISGAGLFYQAKPILGAEKSTRYRLIELVSDEELQQP